MSCSVCSINPIKYTCPACGVKTCSFPCVQKHKQDSKCTGTVDQTKFLGKKELSSTDNHINRDYNFLMNIGRNIDLGKDDIKLNAKNVFKRQFHQRSNNNAGQNNNNKRFKAEDIDPRKYLVNKVFPNSPPSIIRRNNTLVVQLPTGMSRATSNKTGYDKRLGTFIWTIEWVFIDLDGAEVTRFLSYRMKEGTILRDSFPMNILNKSLAKGKENEYENHASNVAGVEAETTKENVQLPVRGIEKEEEAGKASTVDNAESIPEKYIDKSELCFYLENILDKNKKRSIIKLSPELMISEVLTDKVVLEFPTIYVTRHENTWKEYISEQFGEVSSDESSSDSSSEEDSSNDSSDDSSEEESSDNESDDGPPESSSSKAIVEEMMSVTSPMNAVQDETAAEHSA
ncbi:box C/D snoRNA protein 1 [[Candida] railenensis]|uniref:Box C/D snoRNA protein 1 n=1 Tax=[Candida] railenensis TaxID=45579 RepID=A0A9P0QMK3_9ASCO|nr:box C/D snoRNA protein 1 [[Candida] railenensis]